MTVRVTDLPGGLRVVTDNMDTVATVSLGAWVAVGTRHEDLSLNGISHFLEHMAFKGTERRSARAIVEEIEDVGGHLNAYTARESTAYFAKVLQDDLPLAVDIIADILQHPTMEAEELEKERSVILQEIHQAHDTPDDIIFDWFQATAFPDQPMGRPVLGEVPTVSSMPRDTIVDYMRSEYSAPRMVISAAGKVDHDKFVDLVSKAFIKLPNSNDGPATPIQYVGGDYREKRDLEQVHVLIGFDGVSYTDPGYYPLAVLSILAGGGMSSRLFQEAREKRGLVYSIYSFAANYVDGGLFGIYAGTGADEVAELVPVICDEMKKLELGAPDEEIARARAQLKASTLMSLESTSSRCEQAARQLQVYGRPLPTEEVIAAIDAVDNDAIVAAAKRLLASAPTVTALGPMGKMESYEKIRERLN